MTRNIIALIGFALLAGCSGGGGDSAAPSSAPAPLAQPDMLTATPQGLLRGKANGQGQRLIFARANLHQPAFSGDVFVANGLVYYPREAPPIILDYPNQDIWSVRADGTGDHAVLNTTADEFVKDASGNTAIYELGTYTPAQGLERTDYGSLRDGAPLATLPITEPFMQFRFMAGARAYFAAQRQIVSANVDGSGLGTHATVSGRLSLEASEAFDNTLVYREIDFSAGRGTLRAVPVSGGSPAALDDGQSYVSYAGHVGARVVSHRCTIDASDLPPRTGPCDVVSINSDGSGAAVLSSHPANEAVQGIAGNQVIIRRNLAGNDQLVAVPVTGGPERLLMTMTDSEFVQLTAGDFMIVRRPSGTWTLDLNGTLEQIGTVPMDSGFLFVGSAFCGNRGAAAWCMPLDGSTPAVKIANEGKVVGVL